MINARDLATDLDNLSTEDFCLKYQNEDLAAVATAILNDAKSRGIIPAISKPITSAICKFKANQIPALKQLLANTDDKCIHLLNRSWVYLTTDKNSNYWIDIYPYKLQPREQ